MKLSIIVPVFNVEDYIRPCLESILRQGLSDDYYEIIIVNDGTTDRSMEVITDMIEAQHNIQVIEQENQGVSIARNRGLQKASGDYILFIDSDDLLIDDSLPFLLNKAIVSKADLVVADFLKMYDEQIEKFLNKSFIQKDGHTQKKTGKELFLQDLNPYYCHVWRTMYRRDFLNQNNLSFTPHICYEDILFTHQCYLKANLCLKVNWDFIIYRKGHTSITSSLNIKKSKDYCIVISKIWALSHEKDLNEQLRLKLREHTFIYFSFFFYILTSCRSIPLSEKTSMVFYLKYLVPDMTFENGIKQRIVNFLYQKMPSTYIMLRIFYAYYLQNLFWTIGDTIRNKKN